jgi:galactose mutarotase-like enzyme
MSLSAPQLSIPKPIPANIVKLEYGGLVLYINPNLGGAIVGVYLNKVAIMQSNLHASDPRQAACFIMAPFCGWLPKQGFNWLGQHYQPNSNLTDGKPAVHGYGWQSRCEIIEQSNHSLTLNYPPNKHWPWSYKLTQQIELNADSISITLLYTNMANNVAPASLGLHPYFNLTKNTQIQVNNSPKARFNIAHGNIKDECYTVQDWDGHIAISSPELNMKLSTNTNSRHFLGVYRMANADSICLEPITQELNLSHIENPENGFTALEPNQSLELSVEIQLDN